jgi:hypothetical protein
MVDGLGPSEFRDLVAGTLHGEEKARAEAHIRDCETCRVRWRSLRSSGMPPEEASSTSPTETLPSSTSRGTRSARRSTGAAGHRLPGRGNPLPSSPSRHGRTTPQHTSVLGWSPATSQSVWKRRARSTNPLESVPPDPENDPITESKGNSPSREFLVPADGNDSHLVTEFQYRNVGEVRPKVAW